MYSDQKACRRFACAGLDPDNRVRRISKPTHIPRLSIHDNDVLKSNVITDRDLRRSAATLLTYTRLWSKPSVMKFVTRIANAMGVCAPNQRSRGSIPLLLARSMAVYYRDRYIEYCMIFTLSLYAISISNLAFTFMLEPWRSTRRTLQAVFPNGLSPAVILTNLQVDLTSTLLSKFSAIERTADAPGNRSK